MSVIPYCIGINILLSRVFNPLDSYICAFLAYWGYLAIVSYIFLSKNKVFLQKVSLLLKKSNSISLSVVSFVPVIAVFFVAFVPSLSGISLRIVSVAFFIALFNGPIEELFWRGFSIANDSDKWFFPIFSTIIFGIYHSSYLMLDITYKGGAINLVGGSLFMGLIWVIVSRKTHSIKSSILAHQLVNLFAFSSMFELNGF